MKGPSKLWQPAKWNCTSFIFIIYLVLYIIYYLHQTCHTVTCYVIWVISIIFKQFYDISSHLIRVLLSFELADLDLWYVCLPADSSFTVTASLCILSQIFQISKVTVRPARVLCMSPLWQEITTVSLRVWEREVEGNRKSNSCCDYRCHLLSPCVRERVWKCLNGK